mgnify:CR=1 FL=1
MKKFQFLNSSLYYRWFPMSIGFKSTGIPNINKKSLTALNIALTKASTASKNNHSIGYSPCVFYFRLNKNTYKDRICYRN